ncbi:MAG TPA: SDR family NAD(P)-dependent oxidoreductase [Alphaproteobacteria bacterium]|nr:SDR family NAD(P)-dependent oxidoreductase [Alphaproteobacteria bacterium]
MAEQGRIAVITGSNRGLGLETGRQLAAKAYRVVLSDLAETPSEEARVVFAALGRPFHYRRLDVSDSANVRDFTAWLTREAGVADVLVNNAGIQGDSGLPEEPEDFKLGTFFAADVETARRTMNVNAFGAFRMIQALAPAMRERNYGRIVNVASGMGQLADMNGGWPSYRMSKTALNALTRIVANELKGTNVLINSVCPGWMRTVMGTQRAPRSVAQGADTVVWLAVLPDGGPNGGFFRDRKPIPW